MNPNPNEEISYIVPMSQGNVVPQMPRGDRADLIDKIKPDAIVEVIRQRLMGNELINNKWTPIPALKNNSLSEAGAWEISNLMLSSSSINTSISNLNNDEVKKRLLSLVTTAQYLCVSNWRRYGIHNSSQLYFVHEIVFTNALVVLKQADGASIQELLKGTVTENRNINSEQPKSAGKIRRFLGL